MSAPMWHTNAVYGGPLDTWGSPKKHQDHYRMMRDSFQSNPLSSSELAAWRSRDNHYNYHLLNIGKSFIPSKLIGTIQPGAPKNALPWSRSDTFFSEYLAHNDPNLVLSQTPHSYIIGNEASYDRRHYPCRAITEKRPEGQGFGHLLIIPKSRIYNIVDPAATANNCFILHEMRSHFHHFWEESASGPASALQRARDSFVTAVSKMSTAEKSTYQLTRNDIEQYFDASGEEFVRLKAEEDFMMGFHVFPENTIGHLHMHVFPVRDSLRCWSTRDYDYKTVPLAAVLEVEAERYGGE
ncbi:MAG: hypothetical protein Q9220_004777 [cf. Caloplaca sp. 1 TL-2023]